jgi:hypothetical protein
MAAAVTLMIPTTPLGPPSPAVDVERVERGLDLAHSTPSLTDSMVGGGASVGEITS